MYHQGKAVYAMDCHVVATWPTSEYIYLTVNTTCVCVCTCTCVCVSVCVSYHSKQKKPGGSNLFYLAFLFICLSEWFGKHGFHPDTNLDTRTLHALCGYTVITFKKKCIPQVTLIWGGITCVDINDLKYILTGFKAEREREFFLRLPVPQASPRRNRLSRWTLPSNMQVFT